MYLGGKNILEQLVQNVVELKGCKRATKYVSQELVAKATLKGKRSKREKRVELAVTIGKPNYAERRMIKTLKKAGVKFPVRNILLKFETTCKK